MSKSKLNGVSPDEMIEDFGADALRLYEMFMGPFDKEKLWNTDAVTGCRRFLNRFYDLSLSDKVWDEDNEPDGLNSPTGSSTTLKKTSKRMQFNTAIAKMMEFMNAFAPLAHYPSTRLKWSQGALFVRAPHRRRAVGTPRRSTESLTYPPFPSSDPAYLVDETVLYVVQVNGKVRGKWELPKDKSQEELLAFIRTQPQIAKHIAGEIAKVIYICTDRAQERRY